VLACIPLALQKVVAASRARTTAAVCQEGVLAIAGIQQLRKFSELFNITQQRMTGLALVL